MEVSTSKTLLTIEGGAWASAPSHNDLFIAIGSGGYNPRPVILFKLDSEETVWTKHGHAQGIISLSFSMDDEMLASASYDKTVRVWRVNDGECVKVLEGHTDYVNAVCFSPLDLKRLVSGSHDGNVRVWDAVHGECLHVIQSAHDGEKILSIDYSPDGREFATSGSDSCIIVWNASTLERMKKLEGHSNWVYTVVYSPDGGRLASSSADKTVRLWDRKALKCMEILSGHENQTRSVHFSSDGKYLLSGSKDNKIFAWDVAVHGDGILMSTLIGHTSEVYTVFSMCGDDKIISGSLDLSVRVWPFKKVAVSRVPRLPVNVSSTVFKLIEPGPWSLALSHDGKKVAIGCAGYEPRPVILLSYETGETLWDANGHNKGIIGVAFTNDDEFLLSGAYDWNVRVWRVRDGKCVSVLTGHSDNVNGVACSPIDRDLVLSGSHDGDIRVWDISREETIRVLPKAHGGGKVLCVSFSLDGLQFVSGGSDHKILLWWCLDYTVARVIEGHTNWVYSVQFCPDRHRLVSCSADKTIRTWKVDDGSPLETLSGHKNQIRAMAFSPSGAYLFTGSKDNDILVWDISDPMKSACVSTLQGHTSDVYSVAVSKEEDTLLSLSLDKSVRKWNLSAEDLKACKSRAESSSISVSSRIVQTVEGGPWAVKLSPSGVLLAVGAGGYEPRSVYVRNLATDKILWEGTGHAKGILGLSFTHDNEYLVSASYDHTARVWRVRDGTCVHVLAGHTDFVNSTSCTPNGLHKALTASHDGDVRCWTVESGELKYTLGSCHASSKVLSVSYASHGRTFVSTGADHKVRVWDAWNYSSLRVLEGHSNWVYNAVFSPDCSIIASCSADKTMCLWHEMDGVLLSTLKAHTNQIRAVSISPDGTMLLSGSKDQDVFVWNIKDPKNPTRICVMRGHTSDVYSVQFTLDQRHVISGSLDKSLRIWPCVLSSGTWKSDSLIDDVDGLSIVHPTLSEEGTAALGVASPSKAYDSPYRGPSSETAAFIEDKNSIGRMASPQKTPVSSQPSSGAACILRMIPTRSIEKVHVIRSDVTKETMRASWMGERALLRIFKRTSSEESPIRPPFEMVAGALGSVNHPRLAQIFGRLTVDPEREIGGLLVEWMPGGSLEDLLVSPMELTWDQRLTIALDMCAGLVYLHSENMIHGGVKPANVLLQHDIRTTPFTRAKLGDYGLFLLGCELELHELGDCVRWMSPEIALARIEGRMEFPSAASDVFGLGMVLWTMCSMHRPFDDVDDVGFVARMIADGRGVEIPEFCRRECPAYAECIALCCHHDPSRRIAAEDLFRKLENIRDMFSNN